MTGLESELAQRRSRPNPHLVPSRSSGIQNVDRHTHFIGRPINLLPEATLTGRFRQTAIRCPLSGRPLDKFWPHARELACLCSRSVNIEVLGDPRRMQMGYVFLAHSEDRIPVLPLRPKIVPLV